MHETDGRDLTIEDIREIYQMGCYAAGGKGGWAWIINEADGIRRDLLRAFIALLEENLPPNNCIIFTTPCTKKDICRIEPVTKNAEGKKTLTTKVVESRRAARDWKALFSRCHPIGLTSLGLNSKFAKLGYDIAKKEGLNGGMVEEEALKVLKKFLTDEHNNCRAMLKAIEGGLLKQVPITS